MLKALGELHCICTVTMEKYKTLLEQDLIFEEYFEQVFIKELSSDNCLSILRTLKHYYELIFNGMK